LKGISTPSVTHVAPIRPIFVLDKKDHRIVVNRDVDASLAAEENLASIPWEDFEHLVRQLFEWEFGRDGVEVKVTRASRDRGVDAIMFDPDPLRIGKYVLQAKR
jgi:restriction system protein